MRGEAARPFWVLVGIRGAFWIGTALALLWAPAPFARHQRDLTLPVFRAYDAGTDLLFNAFSQWDSGWYLDIAEHGYRGEQTAAFFPLYPLTVRVVTVVTRSPVVAGVLVSLVAAAIAAVLLAQLARPLLGERATRDAVLYFALFPLAFVFTAVYSDGLFIALSIGAFLAGVRRQAVLAGVLAALAVATRSLGLALLPSLFLLLRPRSRNPRELARPLPLLLAPLPILAFALYLDHRLGNATAFVDAQKAFWGRHTPTLGPVGGLRDALGAAYHGGAELLLHLPRGGSGPIGRADQVATWDVLHLLLLAAAAWLTWIAWRELGAPLGLYSLTTLLVILTTPADWFPLLSLPRYLLADFPLFLALALTTEGKPRARELVLTSFAALGAAAAIGFSRHAWIA